MTEPTLKLNKYVFFSDSITYMGHVICVRWFETSKKTFKALSTLPYPINETGRWWNILRKFVTKFCYEQKLENRRTYNFGEIISSINKLQILQKTDRPSFHYSRSRKQKKMAFERTRVTTSYAQCSCKSSGKDRWRRLDTGPASTASPNVRIILLKWNSMPSFGLYFYQDSTWKLWNSPFWLITPHWSVYWISQMQQKDSFVEDRNFKDSPTSWSADLLVTVAVDVPCCCYQWKSSVNQNDVRISLNCTSSKKMSQRYGWKKGSKKTIKEYKSVGEQDSNKNFCTTVANEDKPSSARKSTKYLQEDKYCKQRVVSVGLPGLQYKFD